MTKKTPLFNRIAVIGRAENKSIRETMCRIIKILNDHKLQVYVDETMFHLLNFRDISPMQLKLIETEIDLAIVIGGDGSLLGASRQLVKFNIPVIGINQGTLGFLTDVRPHEIEKKLNSCLSGKFEKEMRSLIEIEVIRNGGCLASSLALNDAVLHKGQNSGMLTLELTIDEEFVCSSRSDGFIISTPTGSTAYALSAGGPIIHPSLRTLLLVPMFPHTLNTRPVVVPGSSICSFRIKEPCESIPQVICDGQTHISLNYRDQVVVKTSKESLTLLHPSGYSYFEACRSKLHWGGRIEVDYED